MRVLPVIDLLGGQVVRGVAGRREEYRPIVSRLTSSTRPLDVARGFREHLRLDELYLADLDAIAGKRAAVDVCAALLSDGFRLWVDAGVNDMDALRMFPVVTRLTNEAAKRSHLAYVRDVDLPTDRCVLDIGTVNRQTRSGILRRSRTHATAACCHAIIFQPVDLVPLIAPDDASRHKLLVENPARLYEWQ